MRANPTPSEKRLKDRLEVEQVNHVFQSVKFSRGTYRIFDFYIPKRRIVIEVDGPYHDPEYDNRRDCQVVAQHKRYTVLRFTNDEVDNNIESVLQKIREAMQP